MELTNEDKKRILDAAIAFAQAMAKLRVGEDRLKVMSALTNKLLGLGLGATELGILIERNKEEFDRAFASFAASLGIDAQNDPFWEWAKKKDEEEKKGAIEKGEEQ